MRRWLLPVLVALAAGLSLASPAAHPWRQADDNQVPGAVLTRGLEPRELALLTEGDFHAVPMDKQPSEIEAQQAVTAALGNFGFTTKEQLESVAYATVTSSYRRLHAAPMILVYLTGVPFHSLGDPADSGGSSRMVVMVDPQTMKFAWASQG